MSKENENWLKSDNKLRDWKDFPVLVRKTLKKKWPLLKLKPKTKKYDDLTQYLMNIYTFTSHHPYTVFAYGETLQIVRSAEKDSKRRWESPFFLQW